MAVDVNARPASPNQFENRCTPGMQAQHSAVENAVGRTVRYEYCLIVDQWGQAAKIFGDPLFRLLESTIHEWQTVLVPHEVEASQLPPSIVERDDPLRPGRQLHEIIIPHDIEDRARHSYEHVDDDLCVLELGRLDSTLLRPSEQVAGKNERINGALFRESRDP
jgi:hypothetical protein